MTTGFIYWKDEDYWIGFLEEYPDYHTLGISFDELRLNLKDLFLELTSGTISNIRKKSELEVAS
jgi:predicted RNase H-like HicB family nuclease